MGKVIDFEKARESLEEKRWKAALEEYLDTLESLINDLPEEKMSRVEKIVLYMEDDPDGVA